MRRLELSTLCLALAAVGCSNDLAVDLSVPALTDVNATSATFEQPVHPNDFQGGISAWYFGHAT